MHPKNASLQELSALDVERPHFFYPPRWVENACLLVPEGLVVSGNDGWITLQKYPFPLKGPAIFRSPEHRRHVLPWQTKPLPRWKDVVELEGEALLGVSNYASSYYHLVSDLLHNVLKTGVQRVLLASDFPPHFVELLRAAGAVPLLLTSGEYRVERLLLPECSYPEWSEDKVVRLRQFFLGREHRPLPAKRRRIFVSRSRAQRRRLVNEQELLPLFRMFGVEVVHLEDLPILEQVKLCSQAEWFLGPHGAGLTHMLVTPVDTKILEIMPIPTSGDFCFSHLAACAWPAFEQFVAAKVSRFAIPPEILKSLFQRWERISAENINSTGNFSPSSPMM